MKDRAPYLEAATCVGVSTASLVGAVSLEIQGVSDYRDILRMTAETIGGLGLWGFAITMMVVGMSVISENRRISPQTTENKGVKKGRFSKLLNLRNY